MRPAWAVAGIAAALVLGLLIGYAIHPDVVRVAFPFNDVPNAKIHEIAKLPKANVRRARGIAKHIWGQACGGNVRVVYKALPGMQSGEANYHYDPTQPLDTRRYSNCTIVVTTATRYSPIIYCGIVVHEWGHLAGHGHSRNPRSVMYPRLTLKNLPDACRHG